MRNYLLRTADPERAPRMAPAVQAMRRLLIQHQSVSYARMVEVALAAGDLKRSTISAWLCNAKNAGLVKMTGTPRTPSYRVRIADWPAGRYHAE